MLNEFWNINKVITLVSHFFLTSPTNCRPHFMIWSEINLTLRSVALPSFLVTAACLNYCDIGRLWFHQPFTSSEFAKYRTDYVLWTGKCKLGFVLLLLYGESIFKRDCQGFLCIRNPVHCKDIQLDCIILRFFYYFHPILWWFWHW